MISSDDAARVGRKAGLSLADAVSLRALADDVAEAERLAAKFGEPDEHAFVRDLFAPPDPDRTTVPGLLGRLGTTPEDAA